ncbi:MAG TPA: hypothetical protein VJ783_18415 [Pirellulales bacterium]|nr:hypothetical protein [Pirellulales bacterium]
MRFRCSLRRRDDGRWSIRHSGEAGVVETSADTREAALEKMRGELRYRLELCPCSGESYQHIEIELDAAEGK